jgi:hypothetical protein
VIARQTLEKLPTATETSIDELYSDQANEHAQALQQFFRYCRILRFPKSLFNICDQLRHQYARWLTVFGRKKIEVITDYSYATAQRIATLLQFYTNFLKDADSYQLTFKKRSLIPMATHQMVIVHFFITSNIMYETN